MHTVGRHTTARQESEAPSPFSHAHLTPALDPLTRTMPRHLKTTWVKLNPSSSHRPPTPPPSTPSFESDLEVNLEDDPDRETTSEEEPEPLPVEEVVFNSLEMARKEEDRHLHAITQKETDDCILKCIVEISKEEERRRRQEQETERCLAMDAERR